MKLNSAWNNEAYDVVMNKLHAAGFVAYAVGGCVRDAVMGLPFNDVDVATNARPHDLTKVFGVRQWDGDSDTRYNGDGVVLYPTGVNHGTWTVRVGEDVVEVTSFRRDVETDGRNATIAFADTMEEDALRRDFTMNALYCDQFNEVHDPTGHGLSDLLAGRVRFVGDAYERVAEDYLRIMRLFRFQARFGRGPMDPTAWSAAAYGAASLVKRVSGERIWDELKKILSLHSPYEALLEMSASGVLDKLFVDVDLVRFSALLVRERENNCAPRWSRRYAALFGEQLPFPCSKAERKQVTDLVNALNGPVHVSQAVMAQNHGHDTAYDWAVFRKDRPRIAELKRGAAAVLPVTAKDLLDVGFEQGPALGQELKVMRTLWERSDLTGTKEELMQTAKNMIRK